MLISELKDKEILILGFGLEGQDTLSFLRKHFPHKNIGIADQKEFEELSLTTQRKLNEDRRVVLYFGTNYANQVNKYDVVIKSPGIPPSVTQPYLKKKQILTSQTNIFLANCPGKIIGVTGTKGKSTVSTLIYKTLKNGGVKAHLVGNIEEPVLQFLDAAKKTDVFVYELSSFQLETATYSPHIAVLLNIYPEHLDHHGNFKTYVTAKAAITKYQTEHDYLIYNEEDEHVQRIAQTSKAHLIPYELKDKIVAPSIVPTQAIFAVAKLFNIPKEKTEKTIKAFKPLPHRLERVGIYQGITFYNDSLATIPQATNAALDFLGKKVTTLIVGGHDRGVSLEPLATRILQSKLRNLILLPSTGALLERELHDLHAKEGKGNLPKTFPAETLDSAVKIAFEQAPKGSVCLFSPAASSFNMFKNYKERGEKFKKLVTRYGKKTRS